MTTRQQGGGARPDSTGPAPAATDTQPHEENTTMSETPETPAVPAPFSRPVPMRTRHRTADAVYWDGTSLDALQTLLGGEQNAWLLDDEDLQRYNLPAGTARLITPQHSDMVIVKPGEWVLRHPDGGIDFLSGLDVDAEWEVHNPNWVIPQSAVDAVLEAWRTAYENAVDAVKNDYKPDPSHAGIVREALTVAFPHLLGAFEDARFAEAEAAYAAEGMATAISAAEIAEQDREDRFALDAADEARDAELQAEEDLAAAAADHDAEFESSWEDGPF